MVDVHTSTVLYLVNSNNAGHCTMTFLYVGSNARHIGTEHFGNGLVDQLEALKLLEERAPEHCTF